MNKKLKNQALQQFDNLTPEQKRETKRLFNAKRFNHKCGGLHVIRNPYEKY